MSAALRGKGAGGGKTGLGGAVERELGGGDGVRGVC